MKTIEEINAIMKTIPDEWRSRWCGGENGPCACRGCVQIGNRLIMADLSASMVDPEHINEKKIPPETYEKYKISKEEWLLWKASGAS